VPDMIEVEIEYAETWHRRVQYRISREEFLGWYEMERGKPYQQGEPIPNRLLEEYVEADLDIGEPPGWAVRHEGLPGYDFHAFDVWSVEAAETGRPQTADDAVASLPVAARVQTTPGDPRYV
jgi:hypothetical protein